MGDPSCSSILKMAEEEPPWNQWSPTCGACKMSICDFRVHKLAPKFQNAPQQPNPGRRSTPLVEASPREVEADRIRARQKVSQLCNTIMGTREVWKLDMKEQIKIATSVHETLDWLKKNMFAEKDVFEAKHRELEGFINLIIENANQVVVPTPLPGSSRQWLGMAGSDPSDNPWCDAWPDAAGGVAGGVVGGGTELQPAAAGGVVEGSPEDGILKFRRKLMSMLKCGSTVSVVDAVHLASSEASSSEVSSEAQCAAASIGNPLGETNFVVISGTRRQLQVRFDVPEGTVTEAQCADASAEPTDLLQDGVARGSGEKLDWSTIPLLTCSGDGDKLGGLVRTTMMSRCRWRCQHRRRRRRHDALKSS